MEIAIIGLPFSGKTTIFNAATRGAAQVAGYSSAARPNIGVAKVPDSRLETLSALYQPDKTTHAEVTYVDLPAAPDGLGQTKGISGEYLNRIQSADALVVAVRAFEDPSVPDGGDGVDAFRDIETMLYELTFADLEILERRLQRIEQNAKSARSGDRDAMLREKALISRLRDSLEDGSPIRNQALSREEARRVNEFQFLTAKPVIVVVNAGEDQMDEADEILKRLESEVTTDGVLCSALFGKMEMELSEMDPEDEEEFRESLGAGESGLDRMVRLSYAALDQITFFTCGPKDVRAWTVTRGDDAVRAAGRIHTDMARGFIRAEVVTYDDLTRCGSENEARKQGVLRQEGKTYTVEDGDIMHFLFNV
ncbi:MAG: redox-regulated ATPase YchF [Dehalococcoidia bacterium]|nr:redox-regulated ATPase YchF [Dehalococcoidia bacterium]